MEGNRSTTRGLGRGLAGILGDAMAGAPVASVDELLGAQRVRRSPEVREMVTEVALSAIANSFDAEGVVLVKRDEAGELAHLSATVPASWNDFDPVGFEIAGRLWHQLEQRDDGHTQDSVGTYRFLLCRQSTNDGPMAAAIVRQQAFDEQEAKVIGDLVRSVGAALGESLSMPPDSGIRVLVRETDEGVLADVRLGGTDDRRHAAAVASEPAVAVARAASELCDIPLDVVFAGQTRVQSSLVTLVVVAGPYGGPLFGLAVNELSAATGPAEAVFAAASVVGADPFTRGPAASSKG